MTDLAAIGFVCRRHGVVSIRVDDGRAHADPITCPLALEDGETQCGDVLERWVGPKMPSGWAHGRLGR